MAQQNHYVTLKIKIGKFIFSKRKRINASFIIENDTMTTGLPGVQPMRNNNLEFTAAVKAGKSFRCAIASASNLADVNLKNRLVKIFYRIKKNSEGISGPRPMLISKHRAELNGIELNVKRRFYNTIFASFTTRHAVARNSAIAQLQNVSTQCMNGVPPSATHFRLIQVLGTIADIVYDEAGKCYKLSNEVLNGLSEATFSAYLPLTPEPVDISLETIFQEKSELSESITVIQGLGIIFYSNTFKEYLPLRAGQAMQIVDVF